MLNIVIPMAGRGSRFANQGFTLPKPMIPVHQKPMIQVVIENLRPHIEHRFIFVVLEEHLQKFRLDYHLKEWAGTNTQIVTVKETTQGAACTVLLAKDLINDQHPLMIANSDQWVDFDINEYLNVQKNRRLDGLIMTMTANDSKWSFVKMKNELVTEVAEKKIISHEATVGIYNFSHGDEFVRSAEDMISQDLRTNGEFYVAPVYNILVAQGKRIGIFNIGSINKGMYGLGVPEDLHEFLQMDISRRATDFTK